MTGVEDGSITGAFSSYNLSAWAFGHQAREASFQGAARIGFNASISNSVYTESGAIRPLGLALNYIIKC